MSLRGLYRHIRTGRLYFVEGVSMDVRNPTKKLVIYCQKYESQLFGSDVILPVGTMWSRPPGDFLLKFEKVPESSKINRLMNSVCTSLEKDIASGYNKVDE